MSLKHEARPSVPGQPSNQELQSETHTNSRRKALIGSGAVLSLVAAGGLVFGLNNGGSEKTEPRADAGTSAPANPSQGGEEVTNPTEAPSAVAPVETSPATDGELTLENFPYVVNGETYEGFDAFVESQQVTLAEYPTPQEALPALVEGVNDWLNSANTPEEAQKYNDELELISEDGQLFGKGAAAKDFYDPAYREALIGSGEFLQDVLPGHGPEEFAATQSDLHLQNISYWNNTEEDQQPYRAEYSVSDINMHAWIHDEDDPEALNEASFTVTLTYADNGHLNTIGQLRSEPGGYRGVTTPQVVETFSEHIAIAEVDGVWKIIGAEAA